MDSGGLIWGIPSKVFRNPVFVPGNCPDILQKALGFAPDAYVPDLEHSVPPE